MRQAVRVELPTALLDAFFAYGRTPEPMRAEARKVRDLAPGVVVVAAAAEVGAFEDRDVAHA